MLRKLLGFLIIFLVKLENKIILLFDRFDPLGLSELTYRGRTYDWQYLNNLIISNKAYKYLKYFWETPDLRPVKRNSEKHRQFLSKYNEGQSLVEKAYYIQALQKFQEASQIYAPEKLAELIYLCQQKSQEEQLYNQQLFTIKQKIKTGKLLEAQKELRGILTKFRRQDGEDILKNLDRIIKGKIAFQAGLKAEKNKQWLEAEQKYKLAKENLTELTEVTLRLGIIAVKQAKYPLAITRLAGLTAKEASYWRGYAYSQQKKWQQAKQEWKNIPDLAVKKQLETIQYLQAKEQLVTINKIKEAVSNNQLEEAREISLAYLAQFGTDSRVEYNLYQHILPSLNNQSWSSKNWRKISEATEQEWLQNKDITSLHNWNVANYYYYQETKQPQQLTKLISSWSTAIANLQSNPLWDNLPWLTRNMINTEELTTNLQTLLETLIDSYKDTKIDTYYQLRDKYRRELLAIKLMQKSNQGVKINNLWITPQSYQEYQTYFPQTKIPNQIWGTLYTDWGLAIAACLEGDRSRGFQLQPSQKPTTEIEKYAAQYLDYQIGCYYLQQKQWQKAIKPLEENKNLITNSADYLAEVNQLCQLQRQELDEKDLDTKLEFAQFWRTLLSTPEANSYFAQLRVSQIANSLNEETMTETEAIKQLKLLQTIDRDNPLVDNLLQIVLERQELLEIFNLMENGRFTAGIDKAKSSTNQGLRNQVAHFCLEISIDAANNNTLPREEVIQLVKWAYELDPTDTECRELYYQILRHV
ncbi:MAG: hypothetical protein EA365_15505 [Gloeocapsa sp. DLM2.Bin57]|nr:MAG: hypothetical protein EA365_15505 [Gloeocapsa sp. DLM2.Bin57]